jgi:TonB family protein
VIEATKQLEGQFVAKLPLRRHLGGDDSKPVFLTERADGSKAVIKLISAEGLQAEKKLSQWKRAAELSHPHLLPLFEMGRCELSGTKYVYVVQEYADENLSEVLPDRALSPEEVRQTLGPALDALGYMHAKGFVNGALKPSNFLAAMDQLRLATDGARQAGESYGKNEQRGPYDPPEKPDAPVSASADIWALGITLVEVLTRRVPAWETPGGEPVVPASLPEPFRDIARNCLRRDPNARWTVPQIVDHLKRSVPPAKPEPPAQVPETPTRSYGKMLPIAVAALIVIVVLAMLLGRHSSSGNSTPTNAALPVPAAEPPEKLSKPGAAHPAQEPGTALQRPQSGVNHADVLHQALPNISPSALRTIRGKIKLRVRVHVNQTGNVTRADMVSAGPSKYFARLAMEAAHDWKFAPSTQSGERRWMLHFDLTRQGTTPSAEPLTR